MLLALGCAALLAPLGLGACSSGVTGDFDIPTGGVCERSELTLHYEVDSGFMGRQFVPARVNGRSGYLTVDTGAGESFLYGPDDFRANHPVMLGCETVMVMQRNFASSTVFGAPVLGVLGADYFMAAPTEIDYPRRRVVRHREGGVPSEPGEFGVPLVSAKGHMAVRADVDGQERLLMVDTGSPHVVLAWTAGRPGDEKVAVQDMSGARVDAFLGDSQVELERESRDVPVYRIPDWPYFESYAKSLHPDLAGLYGRSTLGNRRVVIDARAGELRLGPLAPLPGT